MDLSKQIVTSFKVQQLNDLYVADASITEHIQNLDQKKMSLSFDSIFCCSEKELFFEVFEIHMTNWTSMHVEEGGNDQEEKKALTLNEIEEDCLGVVCQLEYKNKVLRFSGFCQNTGKWRDYILVEPSFAFSFRERITAFVEFLPIEIKKTFEGSLIYKEDEQVFFTEKKSQTETLSVLINDLALNINAEGMVTSVSGYCPLTFSSYQKTEESPKQAIQKNLKANLSSWMKKGISLQLEYAQDYPVYVNKEKGWICIGDDQFKKTSAIEFAPNCVAFLDQGRIKALWLHPKKLPYWQFLYKGE